MIIDRTQLDEDAPERVYWSILLVSADSPEQLRFVDVDRVMEEAIERDCLDKFREWLLSQNLQERTRVRVAGWEAEEQPVERVAPTQEQINLFFKIYQLGIAMGLEHRYECLHFYIHHLQNFECYEDIPQRHREALDAFLAFEKETASCPEEEAELAALTVETFQVRMANWYEYIARQHKQHSKKFNIDLREENGMLIFTIEGLNYQEASRLIETFKQEGMDAAITAGGVSIRITPDRVNRAKEICAEFNGVFVFGYSGHEQNVLMNGEATNSVVEAANNAIAVSKEWQESRDGNSANPAS